MVYVCVGDVMDVVFSVSIVRRGTVGACCMVVSCVHTLAVISAAFCILPLFYSLWFATSLSFYFLFF